MTTVTGRAFSGTGTKGAGNHGVSALLRTAAASGGTGSVTMLTAVAAPPYLPGTGFDGMLVAAVGVALTAGGWLLLLLAGRRHRRGRTR